MAELKTKKKRKKILKRKLTRLPNQQEEPDAPRQVDDQRDSVAGVPEQVDHAEEGPVQPRAQPAGPHGRHLEDRVRRRHVRARCRADEGCREAPGEPDQEEAEHVPEDPRLGHGGRRGVVHLLLRMAEVGRLGLGFYKYRTLGKTNGLEMEMDMDIRVDTRNSGRALCISARDQCNDISRHSLAFQY